MTPSLWIARTNRTHPCFSRAPEIPAPIRARWPSLWSKDKRAWPRLTASAPTSCSPSRSTSSRPRERFGSRADSCGKTPTLPAPVLPARQFPQCPQKQLLYPPAAHSNRRVVPLKRLLHRQTLPSFLNLKLRGRRFRRHFQPRFRPPFRQRLRRSNLSTKLRTNRRLFLSPQRKPKCKRRLRSLPRPLHCKVQVPLSRLPRDRPQPRRRQKKYRPRPRQ